MVSARKIYSFFPRNQTLNLDPRTQLKKLSLFYFGLKTQKAVGLTLHTAACKIASKPPSGASLFRDTFCFCTSSLKRSTLSVRDKRWRKPKEGTQLGNSLYLQEGQKRAVSWHQPHQEPQAAGAPSSITQASKSLSLPQTFMLWML